MRRTGQGLLGSDVELGELLSRVLGDEISAGFAEVARDDIQVGGNSIDELEKRFPSILQEKSSNSLENYP